MAVRVGQTVLTVERRVGLTDTAGEIRVRRVDAGVEHRERRGALRVHGAEHRVPTDLGQCPLTGVRRIGRLAARRANLVELDADDVGVRAVRVHRRVERGRINCDRVEAQGRDGRRLGSAVARDDVLLLRAGKSGRELHDERRRVGAGRGCRRWRGRRGGGRLGLGRSRHGRVDDHDVVISRCCLTRVRGAIGGRAGGNRRGDRAVVGRSRGDVVRGGAALDRRDGRVRVATQRDIGRVEARHVLGELDGELDVAVAGGIRLALRLVDRHRRRGRVDAVVGERERATLEHDDRAHTEHRGHRKHSTRPTVHTTRTGTRD